VATEIRTLPRAVQKELPVWLTAARSPETFKIAGQHGYNVLTHLLGMSLSEVAENISVYRAAWGAAGHAGRGRVTLMMHTFVGIDDQSTRELVREPMRRYLGSAMDLVREAAWTFPTFVQRAMQHGSSPAEIFKAEPLAAEEADALLDHAFDRYFDTSGLFGSPESCLKQLERVAALGVDEIACLIDFGVPIDDVLAQLPRLRNVKDRASREIEDAPQFWIVEDIRHFGATHLQCTPSLASLIAADPTAAAALTGVKYLMVGGEELPLSLARELRRLLPAEGKLLNMYGPTETTIWSTVCSLDEISDFIPLGQPIVNTTLRVVGSDGGAQPALVPGELWIGGAGVAMGYWNRPDLTAERFVSSALSANALMYRTGDIVRRHPDGRLEFLGRRDSQVKVRGHRIELGEIEAALERIAGIAHAVVVAREEVIGDKRLVAYYVLKPGAICDDAGLRAALRDRLPEIMIPATYVRMAALPLTPNSKIDRKALPAPNAIAEQAGATSSDGLEAKIAKIWREVLGIEHVGVTQNFFDLGGHSLSAVQLYRRLRAELACEVSITDIFRFPTVRSLAGHLGERAVHAAADHGLERAKARLGARRHRLS
jgi:acyl carrier protein